MLNIMLSYAYIQIFYLKNLISTPKTLKIRFLKNFNIYNYQVYILINF